MILRSLFCLTVVALTASQIEWKEPPTNPHKAALIRKQIYAVYQPDFLYPLPGSPASITESLIEKGDHTSDTSQTSGSDTTVFEYDKMGNWTKREYRNANGHYASIMTRKITY